MPQDSSLCLAIFTISLEHSKEQINGIVSSKNLMTKGIVPSGKFHSRSILINDEPCTSVMQDRYNLSKREQGGFMNWLICSSLYSP